MVVPCDATVTISRMIVVTNPPMYGMNRPKKTMTASGPARGTPRRTRKSPSAAPSNAAMIAVPRRYPPTRSRATWPLVVIASRRQVLADESTQTHALSPSIMKKKVRNVPRIATVATVPTSAATACAEAANQPWTPLTTRLIANPISGGMDRSASLAWSVARPVLSASRNCATYGHEGEADDDQGGDDDQRRAKEDDGRCPDPRPSAAAAT